MAGTHHVSSCTRLCAAVGSEWAEWTLIFNILGRYNINSNGRNSFSKIPMSFFQGMNHCYFLCVLIIHRSVGPLRTLACDLWEVPGRSVQGITVIQSDWQLVPTTFDGVIDWIYVRSSGRPRDWTRSYAVLYQNPGELDTSIYQYPLVVRIQGFIKACNLAPLGNWNGYVGFTP